MLGSLSGSASPHVAGMGPVRGLELSHKYVRASRPPNAAGMGPLNWLFLSDSSVSASRSPSEAGIGPVNWLFRRYMISRLSRLLRSGMGPLNWLRLSDSVIRVVSSLSEAGIGPVNWLFHRNSSSRGAARDVRIDFPDGSDVVFGSEVQEKFPLEALERFQSVELNAAVCIGTKLKHKIRLTWTDDSSDTNEKMVYPTL